MSSNFQGNPKRIALTIVERTLFATVRVDEAWSDAGEEELQNVPTLAGSACSQGKGNPVLAERTVDRVDTAGRRLGR